MLAASNIVKYHGPQRVLSDVTLVVPPRARIGLVGPNGVGKSTLLRILAGVDASDAGTVRKSGAVAYLPQVAQSHKRSGGEVARAALAEVLRPDFDTLLLDEPTNDLDLPGLEWLERFVHRFDGGIVVVSHDRAFLDRTVTRIVELDEGSRGAREFAGGWSKYAAERDRARARHYERWESSVEERRRLEEQARRTRQWEERGYGQGRKKKKSKDVKKAYAKKLDRVERIEKPYEPWGCGSTSPPPAGRATSCCGSREPSSSAIRSGSGRSTSSSRAGNGSRCSDRTAAARRRCSTRSSGGCR